MQKGKAQSSQLVIFEDGTLYHINLKRSDNIPHRMLLVGSSGRVDAIAEHFDSICLVKQNPDRPEMHLVAGMYKNVRVAAFSCGMGPGNIEIVLNELHALFEYDHEQHTWNEPSEAPVIIRLGTCGTSLPEVPLGALAISRYALGLDNLGVFYPSPRQDKTCKKIESAFRKTATGKNNLLAYASQASPEAVVALEKKAAELGEQFPMVLSGITTCSPGFFAPEGRSIGRINPAFSYEDFVRDMGDFFCSDMKIVNHEMETSILFRLSHEILGYRTGAICLVLDNLANDEMIDSEFASSRLHRAIEVALGALVDCPQ